MHWNQRQQRWRNNPFSPAYKIEQMIIRTILLGALFAVCYQASGQIQTGVFRTPTGNTEYHQFTRTGGGGAAVYINQTDSVNAILRLSHGTSNANVGVVFTVENNGNTGIGTLAPSGRLSVAGGGVTLYSALTNNKDRPAISSGTLAGEIRGMSANSAAMDDGFLRLSAGGGTHATNKSFIDLSGYTASSSLDRYNNITMGTRGVERLRIVSSGYVGIGTKNPTERLSVNGNIRTKEVIVTTDGWPDYVFAQNYKLPSLSELERQISMDGHLPGLPSAAEVAKSGVSLGHLNKLLTRKIEELTLYIIQQQKEIDRKEAGLAKQGHQLQELSKRLQLLEEAVMPRKQK